MDRLIFLLPLVVFWSLGALSLASARRRSSLVGRDGSAWVLDLSGLLVQGWGVPLAQATLVVGGLSVIAPEARGVVDVPPALALALNLVAVDYLYYWNHRLLHTRGLWPVHRVHHSLDRMDVVGTSRNTLWSSLLIVYLWVNGAAVYLLDDPSYFVLGAALTAALDLWRHSDLGPRRGSAIYRLLSPVLILPSDHRWHHSREDAHGNYGANLSIWDRLHGTYVSRGDDAPEVGIDPDLSLWRRLVWPFSPDEGGAT